MASELKPKSARGYDAQVTLACERTLLTLLTAFGSLKHTIRLVGGLVPRYLTPVAAPDVPAHAGTSDVDVVLNLQLLAQGNGYSSLAEQLKARGFQRHLNAEGNPVSWRWKRQLGEHLEVFVELIRDAGGLQPGKAVGIDGERVSAMCFKHAGITADWYGEREINAELLDGLGASCELIRFADVPAFVILKAIAFEERQEPKDAADLIHVIRYAGTLEQVTAMFIDRLESGLHRQALADGFAALRKRFCDGASGPGFDKVGPVAYARFHDKGDRAETARHQRFAAGYVQALLDGIEAHRA